MKKMAIVMLVLCLGMTATAQKVFFMYLQSENRTPFYVRLADKVHSSSSSGYLILSNLKDSSYTLSIGYPGVKAAESRFSIPVEGSDKGFLLKTFDAVPGLFDLQSMTVYRPLNGASVSEQTTTRTDSFTRRLAQAADDASLLTVPVVEKVEPAKPKETVKESVVEVAKTDPVVEEKKTESPAINTTVNTSKPEPPKVEDKPVVNTPMEEKKAPAVVPIINTDTITVTSVTQPKEEAKSESATVPVTEKKEPIIEQSATVPEEPYRPSKVVRRSESSTTEGFGLVYLDTRDGVTDTIRLLIPNPKKAAVVVDPVVVESTLQVQSDVQTKNPTQEITVAPEKPRNACNSIATEKDFLKLRKNMAAETNDEEMIAEARKYFKTKCFTTEQIRYLSTLFLTNAAKYQFFDAAYLYVSDSTLFPTLRSEIKDEYYTKRFKALIGE